MTNKTPGKNDDKNFFNHLPLTLLPFGVASFILIHHKLRIDNVKFTNIKTGDGWMRF